MGVLPIANRRNGRVQLCATTAMATDNMRPTIPQSRQDNPFERFAAHAEPQALFEFFQY